MEHKPRENKKSATTQESPPWLLELDSWYPQIDCSRLWPNADRRFVLWPRESADSCCWVSSLEFFCRATRGMMHAPAMPAELNKVCSPNIIREEWSWTLFPRVFTTIVSLGSWQCDLWSTEKEMKCGAYMDHMLRDNRRLSWTRKRRRRDVSSRWLMNWENFSHKCRCYGGFRAICCCTRQSYPCRRRATTAALELPLLFALDHVNMPLFCRGGEFSEADNGHQNAIFIDCDGAAASCCQLWLDQAKCAKRTRNCRMQVSSKKESPTGALLDLVHDQRKRRSNEGLLNLND